MSGSSPSDPATAMAEYIESSMTRVRRVQSEDQASAPRAESGGLSAHRPSLCSTFHTAQLCALLATAGIFNMSFDGHSTEASFKSAPASQASSVASSEDLAAPAHRVPQSVLTAMEAARTAAVVIKSIEGARSSNERWSAASDDLLGTSIIMGPRRW